MTDRQTKGQIGEPGFHHLSPSAAGEGWSSLQSHSPILPLSPDTLFAQQNAHRIAEEEEEEEEEEEKEGEEKEEEEEEENKKRSSGSDELQNTLL